MKTSRIFVSTVAAAAFAVLGSGAFAAPVWEIQGRSSQITGGSPPSVQAARHVTDVAGRDSGIAPRVASRSLVANGDGTRFGRT